MILRSLVTISLGLSSLVLPLHGQVEEITIGGIIGENVGQALDAVRRVRENLAAFTREIKAARLRYRECGGTCAGKDQIEAEFARLLWAKDMHYAYTRIMDSEMRKMGGAAQAQMVSMVLVSVDGGIPSIASSSHRRWTDCLLREMPQGILGLPQAVESCENNYVEHRRRRDLHEYYEQPGKKESLLNPDSPAVGASLFREELQGQGTLRCVYGPFTRLSGPEGSGFVSYDFSTDTRTACPPGDLNAKAIEDCAKSVCRGTPLYERESRQHRMSWSHADSYCTRDPSLGGGLDTPACDKLIGFVNRGRPYVRNGTTVPPTGEPVQLMTCVYAVITNPRTRQGPRRSFTFWYQRVPDNLSSYAVAGRGDPFPRVIPIAITECPADSGVVAALVSGSTVSSEPSPSDAANARPPVGVEAVSRPTAAEAQVCYGGPWAETASDFTWTITPVGDSLRLGRDDRAAEGMFGWGAGQSRWAGTLRWWNGHLFPGMTLVPASPGCEFQQLTITSPGLTAVMARSTVPVAANPIVRSLASETLVQITFVNSTSAVVEVFWVDFAGEEQRMGVIPAGTSVGQGSYVTHVWRFKLGDRVLGTYTTLSTPEQRYTIQQ